MIIHKTIADLALFLQKQRLEGVSVGFVPTMGALHKGHISLIEECKKRNGLTVCSIFVNPTQFNDKNDFEKYPINLEDDITLLMNASCDVLFLPQVEEIYPDITQLEHYELGEIETILEGKYRPGHFQGVCQVVHRLLSIVNPTEMLLGQKDYQQCMVISKLISLTKIATTLVICSTVREESGLAMSSRNMRLSEADKTKATIIYQSLLSIKANIASQPIALLTEKSTEQLLANGFSSVDYVAICDANTLQQVETYHPAISVVVVIAAFISGVRLIDNLLIS